MPLMAMSLLASCGNKNTTPTISKCDLDGAVSLFSRNASGNPLKLKSSNKNDVNPSGLIKRTLDSVMSAPLLDPNGNEVTYEVNYVIYLDENYVFVRGTVPSYGTKNVLLNINDGQIIDPPKDSSIAPGGYNEAPFTKNCYYDENGNMYLFDCPIDPDGKHGGVAQGIYLYDKNANVISKHLLPDDYWYGGGWFIVKENKEMTLDVVKYNDADEVIDEKLLYFDKDGNSKLVELPYDISSPDLIIPSDS